MASEASFWQQLRQRRTLVASDQCLLDLDERLKVLESQTQQTQQAPAQPGPASSRTARGGLFGYWATPTDQPAEIGEEITAESGPEEVSSPASQPESVAPIPVSERLPELHELDRQGRCWAYRSTTHEPLGRAWVLGTPVSLQLTRPWCSFTHWLPHWSLPIVEEEAER